MTSDNNGRGLKELERQYRGRTDRERKDGARINKIKYPDRGSASWVDRPGGIDRIGICRVEEKDSDKERAIDAGKDEQPSGDQARSCREKVAFLLEGYALSVLHKIWCRVSY